MNKYKPISLFSSKGSSVDGSEKRFIAPKSQALIYEFQLQEMATSHPGTPRVEKTHLCFQILEELTEQAGAAYKLIMRTIQEELKQSVYSQVITSTLDEPYLEKIPYFTLIQRFEKQRIQTSSKSGDYVAEILQKLKFRDHDLTILYKKNLAMKQTLKESEEIEDGLKERVRHLEAEVKRFAQKELENDVKAAEATCDLRLQIDQLQNSLQHSNTVIEKLSLFKTGGNKDAALHGLITLTQLWIRKKRMHKSMIW